MTELMKIDFHGSTILAVAGDTPNNPLIVMKTMVEDMGLAWTSQRHKIKHHPTLSKGTTEIVIPSAGGPQEMTVVPLSKLNFWFATLYPNKIKDKEVRKRIELYQDECADVLFAHFGGGVAAKRITLRDVGGVVKGITAKAMAEFAIQMAEMNAASEKRVEEAIAASEKRAREAAAASEARMEAIAHGHDPSVGRRMKQKTMLEIVQENGVHDKKGRAKLTRALSAGMVPWCRANGVLTGQTSERKTILYPVECIPRWLDEVGRAKILAHIAHVSGQSTFDFAAEKKKRGK